MSHRSEILAQVAELRIPGKIINADRAIKTLAKYIHRGEYLTGFAECLIGSKPGIVAVTSSERLIILKQDLLSTQLVASTAVYDIYEAIHAKKWGNDVLTIKFSEQQIELARFNPNELQILLNAFRRCGISPRDATAASAAQAENILFDDEIIKLIQQGRNLEAIDLYMVCANSDLANAKVVIESLMSETRLARETNIISDYDLNAQIRVLVNKNRKIDAILLVRSQKGYGLKEAKDYVESV